MNKSVENVENSQLSTGISGFCEDRGPGGAAPDIGAELRKNTKTRRRIPRQVTDKLLEFLPGKVVSFPAKIDESPDAFFAAPKSL